MGAAQAKERGVCSLLPARRVGLGRECSGLWTFSGGRPSSHSVVGSASWRLACELLKEEEGFPGLERRRAFQPEGVA